MILCADSIREMEIVHPCVQKTIKNGMSYGLSIAGYDVRAEVGRQSLSMPPGSFHLVSTVEVFKMPKNVLGVVHDKSTWARQGLAVQNTVLEPGWEGYLTMEITNHSKEMLFLHDQDPIAQIIFHVLDKTPGSGYDGKYNQQSRGPQGPIFEE